MTLRSYVAIPASLIIMLIVTAIASSILLEQGAEMQWTIRYEPAPQMILTGLLSIPIALSAVAIRRKNSQGSSLVFCSLEGAILGSLTGPLYPIFVVFLQAPPSANEHGLQLAAAVVVSSSYMYSTISFIGVMAGALAGGGMIAVEMLVKQFAWTE
jgi:hypothetical protein